MRAKSKPRIHHPNPTTAPPLPEWISPRGDNLHLKVRLQPRSSRNEVQPPLNGCLRIRVTAPPVDQGANTALTEFLAEVIGCSRALVEIVHGHSSRTKVVALRGLKADSVVPVLAQAGGFTV